MKKRIVGKRTGCDVIEEGYHIAPMYVDSFNALQERQAGVNRLLASVTDHCVDINMAIEKAKRVLWDSVQEDLGLDKSKEWQYEKGFVTEIKRNEVKKGKEGGKHE